MKDTLFKNTKFLYGFIVLLLLAILWIGGVFWYEKYQIYKAEKQVEEIHTILATDEYSRDNCEQILSFQSEKIDISKVDFRRSEFNDFRENCDNIFNIAKQEQTLEFCQEVIKGRKSSFKDTYIVLDEFKTVQEQCTLEYLTVTFSTGALFDVENDFKSSVHIDFGLPFYEDTDDINSEAFIENRTAAKQRLIDLLEITPWVELTPNDVVLHPTSGTLVLALLPETSYTFALKSFDSQIEGESVESESFTLTTPKNTFFGLRKLDKVSLMRDSTPVDFELISYDTDKTWARVKICRVSNENYAKIEVFQEQSGMREEKKDFFLSGIDKLENYECHEKEITFDETGIEKLKKKAFDFSDLIGNPARSGLYYVTFSNASERLYNERVQEAIFFGIIDSHVTMKVARDGKAFFFVNNLAGKPLAGQEIRAYANDFIAYEKRWNGPKRDYDITYKNPLEESVFDEPVLLGITNDQGILEVDMKEKVDSVFHKTFASWDFDWNGNYDSFFITSASDTNLSYVSSKWNGWISGWNFWYTTGWWWWYGESENMDEISLSRWDSVEPSLYSHSYADRKLYLPGEQVHLKSIVRNSRDLSIPTGKELQMKIRNPKGEESHNFSLTVNDYGSITRTLELGQDAILWNYYVTISDDDEVIGNTAFSVEVFKNPKFKNEIMLQTVWLNGELVQKLEEKSQTTSWGYKRTEYTGNFEIKASVKSDYYSGSPVENAEFTYKVYKQYHYDNSYWDDCYYGCYWEPEKEFYTEWTWKLDANGTANMTIPVEFSSYYGDYKYIVEVTVTDSAGDTISGANAIIARLPEEYKRWNPESGVYFETEKRFYKQGESFEISGGLLNGDFTSDYDDTFVFIIKKKDYSTTYVKDVRGQERPITRSSEKIEKILPVNTQNFSVKDGKLSLNYSLEETGEYIFEFGRKEKPEEWESEQSKPSISWESKQYFTLISYGDQNAQNPVESDNKITVLSEKVSYRLGDTARVLVRLPYENGKILWTVEKQWVIEHEYIDVPGNTFFKEVKVDDTFVPNAYIGVLVVDTNGEKIPEYKVGYTEIVVDKTDKKSEISISANKKTYEPRETVTLDIKVSKPSELTVMVVDDSLISLMGNIDGNALEKFYKKLPFQIQTSITNIAMLGNYYFSRQWIVGGSGFGNFKGGDSAVSSRNIFKNTAYYNPSVITDNNWNAKVTFDLPDNLTNFRVMVLGQSKDNFFGYAEEMIEVRKDVIVEDRTPLILREGDTITLGANVFNTTDKEIGFKALISADGLEIADTEKLSLIPAGGSEFISWTVKNTKSCPYLQEKCEIPYMISVLGDSAKHSDKIEGTIRLKYIPSLVTNNHKWVILQEGESADLSLAIGENTDETKSSYTLTLSNNPLLGIEKIVKSLAVYPFGCGEQLLSSTFPNAVLKRFSWVLADTGIDATTVDKNLAYGLEKINEMSLKNGAFKYWYNDSQGDAHITAYGVRILTEMQKSGTQIDTNVLGKAVKYLEENYAELEDYAKVETLWSLARYHGSNTSNILGISDLTAGYDTNSMSRHELIAYTYGLILADAAKYQSTIDANILKIGKLLEAGKEGSYYYSHLGDTGEFTQLLIDYGADKKLITHYIKEMYDRDWESYWYSTKTKSNAFLAFVKYIETYGAESLSTISLDLNGNVTERILGADGNSYQAELPLTDVAMYGQVGLKLQNVSGAPLFANANIKEYPLDALKVPSFSDGVKLKRSIYEVVDSSDVSETCRWNNGNRTCTEASGLKIHSGNTFKKGAMYKIVLEADFDSSQRRQNITMEDYLPAGFTILNSNFKTNQIATNQETTDSWRWSYTEKNPDVVLAHAKNAWGSSARYEYFVRADFAGDFIYPPAVVYLMYQPDTRANSEFRRVIIK